MQGTSFSDKELVKWSEMKHAGRARAYWEKDPYASCVGSYVAIGALSGEALEMRRILREFIARHEETTQDPLVLRAVELLGFNLEPSQPMFPKWPERQQGQCPDRESRGYQCELEAGHVGFHACPKALAEWRRAQGLDK